MSLVVPFNSDDRAYTFNCTLNAVKYTFDTYYNERDSVWYFDLYLADSDTLLASSIPILLGQNLLAPYGYLGIGGLFAVHLASTTSKASPNDTATSVLVSEDAGADDLGTRVIVVYLTPEELSIASPAAVLLHTTPGTGGFVGTNLVDLTAGTLHFKIFINGSEIPYEFNVSYNDIVNLAEAASNYTNTGIFSLSSLSDLSPYIGSQLYGTITFTPTTTGEPAFAAGSEQLSLENSKAQLIGIIAGGAYVLSNNISLNSGPDFLAYSPMPTVQSGDYLSLNITLAES